MALKHLCEEALLKCLVRPYSPWGRWLYVFHVSCWYLILGTVWVHVIIDLQMNEWVSEWRLTGRWLRESPYTPTFGISHRPPAGTAQHAFPTSLWILPWVIKKSRLCCSNHQKVFFDTYIQAGLNLRHDQMQPPLFCNRGNFRRALETLKAPVH